VALRRPTPARYACTMRIRRTLLALLVTTALAACGGGDGDADGGEATRAVDGYTALRAAPEATLDAGPAKLHYLIEVGGQRIEADGVADMAHQLMSLDLAIPGAGEVQMVVRERTLYMQVPEEARSELGVTTPWLSIDTLRAGEAVTGMTSGVGGSNDPGDALAGLRGVAEDGVDEVGTEELRGVRTTHFRADVDLRKAIEESGDVTDREAFERFAEQLGGGTATYDVWLDDDGLVRKLRFDAPVQGTEVVVTMELYDFGEADLPLVPAAEDVTDITDRAIAEAGRAPS
jgi:hypothetical protein